MPALIAVRRVSERLRLLGGGSHRVRASGTARAASCQHLRLYELPGDDPRGIRGSGSMTLSLKEVVRSPLRSVVAGTAGTAAMSLFYAIDHRLHPLHRGPLDYDDSIVPGEIVANILNLSGVTGRDEAELALALRWSYGSVFGLWHGLLRRRLPEPWASTAFGATLMTATLTLFPLLGRTPPPWRWPRGYLATSFASHAAYAGAVAAADDGLRRWG